MKPVKRTIKKPNCGLKSIVKKRGPCNVNTVAANIPTSQVPQSSSSGGAGAPKVKKPSLDDMESIEQPAAYIQCPICLESCAQSNPVSTKCGHLFCEGCLNNWLKEKKKTCPSCEGKLVGKTAFHKIFP